MTSFTEESIERGARALAEALHGGRWETHYTEGQRQLWVGRVRAVLGAERPDPGTDTTDAVNIIGRRAA
jgi:hypothetical protein